MVAQIRELTASELSAIQASVHHEPGFNAALVGQHVAALAYVQNIDTLVNQPQDLATEAEKLEELLLKARTAGQGSAAAKAAAEHLTNFAATASDEDVRKVRPAMQKFLASHPATKSGLGDSTPVDPNDTPAQQVWQWVQNVLNNPNNPKMIEGLLTCLIGLSPSDLNDPDVQRSLAAIGINPDGSGANLTNMVNEIIETEYFESITGADGQQTGASAGATAFIQQMLALIGNGNNAVAVQMKQAFQSFNVGAFDSAHYDGNWYFWVLPPLDPNASSLKITWTTEGDSNYTILQCIANGQTSNSPLSPNPYAISQDALNALARQHRKDLVEGIWDQTHNLGVLVMYFMMSYDDDFQSQEGGLANTTNTLSSMTNDFADNLVGIAQSFGNLDPTNPADVQKVRLFVAQFLSGTALMNIEPSTNPADSSGTTIASTWYQNVYQQIMNTTFNDPNVGLERIGDLINNYASYPSEANAVQLLKAFNELNPPAPTPTPIPPGPPVPDPNPPQPVQSPAYTAIINGLQQAGALITGTSKTVSTQLSAVSNLDNQAIKMGSSFATADGGGWVQMINQIINNQRSN